jgi:hypothetical protein
VGQWRGRRADLAAAGQAARRGWRHKEELNWMRDEPDPPAQAAGPPRTSRPPQPGVGTNHWPSALGSAAPRPVAAVPPARRAAARAGSRPSLGPARPRLPGRFRSRDPSASEQPGRRRSSSASFSSCCSPSPGGSPSDAVWPALISAALTSRNSADAWDLSQDAARQADGKPRATPAGTRSSMPCSVISGRSHRCLRSSSREASSG